MLKTGFPLGYVEYELQFSNTKHSCLVSYSEAVKRGKDFESGNRKRLLRKVAAISRLPVSLATLFSETLPSCVDLEGLLSDDCRGFMGPKSAETRRDIRQSRESKKAERCDRRSVWHSQCCLEVSTAT